MATDARHVMQSRPRTAAERRILINGGTYKAPRRCGRLVQEQPLCEWVSPIRKLLRRLGLSR